MPKITDSARYAQLRKHYENSQWQPIFDFAKTTDLKIAPIAMVELVAASYAATDNNEEAVQVYELMIAREPKNVIFLLNLARTLTIAGRPSDAIAPLTIASETDPKNPEPLHRLGIAHELLDKLVEAREFFERAIVLSQTTEVRHDYAKLLVKMGEYDDSCKIYEGLDEKSFDDAEIANDYGVALLEAGKSEAAVAYFRKSVNQDPSLLLNQQNLAKALVERGSYLEAFNIANSLMSGDTKGLHENDLFMDIALPLQRMGRFKESWEIATTGAQKYPDDKMLALQQATMGLALNVNQENWRGFQARHRFGKTGELNGALCPVWHDEELSNKSLLIWTEQSYGDQLVFLSGMEIVGHIASEITLVVHARMAAFAEHHLAKFRNAHIVTWEQAREPEKYGLIARDYDFQMYLGDPWANYWEDHQPHEVFSKLTVPPERVRAFKSLTRNSSAPRIGISWFSGRGGRRENEQNRDRNRYSLADYDLIHLNKAGPIDWFNLQFGELRAEILNAPGSQNQFFSVPGFEANGDILNYGAQIAAMDLIISIDSTAAVFAACLGKPTWILCPNDPYWFWTVNEQMQFLDNVSIFIKPWNLTWGDFLMLEVTPRLEKWLEARTP